MKRRSPYIVIPCFVTIFLRATVDRVVAQDSLTAARELYSSASYEEALAVLNRLRASTVPGVPGEESPAIEQYRAFCLLALGRSDEAYKATEAPLGAAPPAALRCAYARGWIPGVECEAHPPAPSAAPHPNCCDGGRSPAGSGTTAA